MASTARRKPVSEAGPLSEDTVEQEFGGDYSEASLEVIRALGPKKGAPFGEVDPAEQATARPPTQQECDAAKAQLEAYKREIEAAKAYVPSERERAAIDVKRSLVLDATPEELTWLKMREYYAAQRAAAAAAAANGAASTSAAGAGDATDASTVAALRAEMLRVAMEALGSATETDELEARAASQLAAGSAGRHGRAGAAAGAAAPAEAASAAALAAAVDAAVATVMAGTSSRYREDYLEEERLTRQVARQRGQRSQAFALSLAAAVGLSAARWWLRRGRGAGGGAGAAGTGGGSGGPSRSRSTQQMQ